VQLIGMRTAKVERRTLTAERRTVGAVTANERGLAQVSTRYSGWIEELVVEETGKRVRKGELLARIFSPEVHAAQQEYLHARAGDQGASGTATHGLAAAARRRLELLGVSAADLAELDRTGEAIRALPVRSPVSGHVTRKTAIQGGYVQPGTELYEIADLSTVWVLAEVFEHDVARVHVGQPARLAMSSYPGETFVGKITFLYPTVDPATRTLRARIELANRDLRLRPGMYGEVHLALTPSEGLVVPYEALIDVGTVQYVFVSRPGGRFEPRKVTVGARTSDSIQIVDGLAEGETVVTTGNFLLDSESRLEASFHAGHGSH
jgi:Cu(I)/Ag(I) efflux system membrane fusion protein